MSFIQYIPVLNKWFCPLRFPYYNVRLITSSCSTRCTNFILFDLMALIIFGEVWAYKLGSTSLFNFLDLLPLPVF